MDTEDYNIFDDVIDNDDYSRINQNFFIEESLDTRVKYISSTINSKIRTLSEVFLEWFLFDSSEEKTLESFIKSENIDAFITPEQFMDIMSNKAHLDEHLILLVQQKLPFQVPLKKMYYLNSQARKNYTYCIKVPPEIIHDLIKKELNLKKEKIKQQRKQYYEQNRDKIAKQKKQYCEINRDKIAKHKKQYYEENRDKILEYTKQYYEKNRDKIAKHQKQYYEENRDKILEYREQSRDKIAEYKKQYYKENRDKIAEYQKQYQEKNRNKIAGYQKQYREENHDKMLKYQQMYKERKEMAKSVCPAFLFLDSLKKENIVVYLTLHKKHSDIIGKAVKSCRALQNMDFTLCPLFKSVDSEQYMKESCPMPNAFVLPQSFDIIRNFVTVLKQR